MGEVNPGDGLSVVFRVGFDGRGAAAVGFILRSKGRAIDYLECIRAQPDDSVGTCYLLLALLVRLQS